MVGRRGTPPGAQPGPPRLLVSFTGDGVALRTAPLQQAAPPALGCGEDVHQHDARRVGIQWRWHIWLDVRRVCLRRHWQVPGDAAIRVAVQVNDSLDGFSGPFKTDFIGADGQVLASSSGSVEGTRMQVEALG